MRSEGKDGCVVGQPVRRWRQGRRGGRFGYALLSLPLVGRSGRVRCSVLLRDWVALFFRGLLAFFTWPGTWATSSKTVSFGLSAWTVVVLPFRDAFAGFRLRVLSVGAGELAFLDWGAPDLAFLRGLRRVITKVDSNVRSLDSPACTGTTRRLGAGCGSGWEYPRVHGFTQGSPPYMWRHLLQSLGVPRFPSAGRCTHIGIAGHPPRLQTPAAQLTSSAGTRGNAFSPRFGRLDDPKHLK